MAIEKGEYEVLALDADGFDVSQVLVDTLGEAKRRARNMVADKELVKAGMKKVEVRNCSGQCIRDFFVA